MEIGVGSVTAIRVLKTNDTGVGFLRHGWWLKFPTRQPVAIRSIDSSGAHSSFYRRANALNDSIDRVLAEATRHAVEELKSRWPNRSAATLHRFTNAIPLLLGVMAFIFWFTPPGPLVLSVVLLLPTVFRFWVLGHSLPPSEQHLSSTYPDLDENLPVYSVIAALRGETAIVDQLLSAIERLDYPAEKLDVILVVEADDGATRAAISARKHRIAITVVPVAPAQPRTKPKALAVGLPLAKGTFTVVYDAEDRPQSNQLRRALQAFQKAGDDLACVQAKLCTDTETTWLARYFTSEYAAQFDFFLPKLAALGLPLPLGGSSNHFRTAILREVGGWDPFNVTEDADLGMRLARFGYRTGVINSTTYEEAPADIRRWIGQRSRWFKGWMQTWLVHMREPFRLFGDLGFRGFLAFQFIVGGNALVALVHPVFVCGLMWAFVTLTFQNSDPAVITLLMHLFVAMICYGSTAALGWVGLRNRGVARKACVFGTPWHWLLLSFAAWSAACELIHAPYHWKKTEHGVDKSFRRDRTIRALLGLERHLSELETSSRLPPIWRLEISS
jgi:cellulose synthase/poly-beta-1,6-N-acetylglucosamine synthase-like glycosyltransferase